MVERQPIASLTALMSEDTLQLLTGKGSEFVSQVGLEVVRGVVLDVLSGKNLRDSTETLTRRRIATLNLATLKLFLEGAANSEDFVSQLPYSAAAILGTKGLAKTERWLAQWVLGLTDKAVQNVLRDNREALVAYRDQYIKTCQEVVAGYSTNGNLIGMLQIGNGGKAQVDWLFMIYLLNTIGTQTLTIRGSEKSAYGKLFEKLILGSLLQIFGFKQVPPKQPGTQEGVFWLSSREDKRESDATLLYQQGQGIRFDIGFIGRGNPEISLDKVSRFERKAEYETAKYDLATIILVDSIGKGSRIVELARRINGTIVQMSANYWPKQVALILQQTLGFKHELVDMPEAEIEDFLRVRLNSIPLENLIGQVQVGLETDLG